MTRYTLLYVAGADPADTDAVHALEQGLDGTTVHTAASLAAAKTAIGDIAPECVVTEHELPDGTGLELLAHVRDVAPDTGCILFTTVERSAIDTTAFGDVLPEYVNRTRSDALDRLVTIARTTLTAQSQTAYPLPEDEPSRLETLASLDLDAGSVREELERITTRAADRFDVPLASVGIISAHAQDFLVTHGADWTTIPREDTVCTYTILEDDVTVIEDLKDDLRFVDNEAIAELDIRFYAGAPLRIGDTTSIGTLCLYDHEPRSFTADERASLQELADEVVEALTRRTGRSDPDGAPDSTRSAEDR